MLTVPSSISKKRSADLPIQKTPEEQHQERVAFNRKRGFRISTNARQNRDLYKTVNEYIFATDFVNNNELAYFINLRRSLQQCCQHSLYRKYSNGSIEYIASQTCKHKLCMVCNAERSKQLRRKYMAYFDKGQMIDKKTGEISTREDFDYMHLTLTVPHSEQGWKGKQWYAPELMAAYNKMRKCEWWNKHVWGGEFGIEMTRNQSGNHIHIHSLLIVNKSHQNRNELHRLILKKWNELTIDPQSQRDTLTPETIESIRKGNSHINEGDLLKLNPKGATFIGLESLYILTKSKKANTDRWIEDVGKWKHYINPNDRQDFIAGILECLKYHFEPLCMDKKTGVYNFELLREILPNIYRKPLYRKFGNLHGVKELNLTDNIADDVEEAVEEHGHQPTNPETGAPDESYTYLIANASAIYWDMKNNLRPKIPTAAKVVTLSARNLIDAILDMIHLNIAQKRASDSKWTEIKHNTSL